MNLAQMAHSVVCARHILCPLVIVSMMKPV